MQHCIVYNKTDTISVITMTHLLGMLRSHPKDHLLEWMAVTICQSLETITKV